MAEAVVSCPPATSPIFRPPRVSVCERQPSLERLANGWLITLLSVAFACMRQKTAISCHSSVRLPGAAGRARACRCASMPPFQPFPEFFIEPGKGNELKKTMAPYLPAAT